MHSVECILKSPEGIVLRRVADSPLPRLEPISGPIRHGESALEACLRIVKAETGLTVSPSCAAVFLHETPGRVSEYTLAFVADAGVERSQLWPAGSLQLACVGVEDLSDCEELSELQRRLLPQVLAAGTPVTIVLETGGTGDGLKWEIGQVAPIDPARLSPLVFATTP